MKKLLLNILAVFLFSISAQAYTATDGDTLIKDEIISSVNNSFEKVDLNKEIDSDITITKTIVINADGSCSILHSLRRADGSEVGSFWIEAPDGHPDCGGVIFHMVSW